MQSQKGDEEPETDHHEERTTRHDRDMPGVRDENVQDRGGIEKSQAKSKRRR